MGHAEKESKRIIQCIGCVQIVETNFKNKKDANWIKWMKYGRRLGCHQMPERSLFVKGYQFPVCARCTGVIISSFLATFIFFWYRLSIRMSILFCVIMFIDWFIQRINIRASTNLRRFVTGLFGGYGFMTLQMYLYWGIYVLVSKYLLGR